MYRHSIALAKLLQSHFQGPIKGVEVGVAWGATSEVLLRRLPELHLAMVDPWMPWKLSKGWFRGSGRCEIELKTATNRTEFASARREILQMTSLEAAVRFSRHSLDFVFIDGSHKYRDVKNDITVWSERVKPGALLIGHDYVDPVPQGFASGRYPKGVKLAVDEMVTLKGWELNRSIDTWLWWVTI